MIERAVFASNRIRQDSGHAPITNDVDDRTDRVCLDRDFRRESMRLKIGIDMRARSETAG